jgi:pimeloyl-ACP methyl ester carboxylesterase
MIARVIDVDGLRIRYAEAGDGPPVILIPGLGLTARFYAASFPAFAEAGLRLIVPDPPGFGASGAPHPTPDIPAMAALMTAFAGALRIDRAVWIGHSVSAQVCLALAAARPETATRLVLVGPTGGARKPRLRQAAGIAREALRAPFRSVATVAADYLRTSPRRYLALWLAAARDDTLAHARRVRCPTLILVGTADPVVPADAIARLLQALPDGRLMHVPGAGHALPHEDPAALHRIVLSFLSGPTVP